MWSGPTGSHSSPCKDAEKNSTCYLTVTEEHEGRWGLIFSIRYMC